MTATVERTFDWKPNHDDRNRDYPIRALIPANGHRHDRLWAPGPVLDQGREGACTGYAFASEAAADPIPVELDRVGANVPRTWDLFAKFLYGMARYLDPWPGEAYEGTSTLAAAQAAQNVGVLKEYRWAFGIDDVIDTVVWKGPVVLGLNWYQDMYEAPGGLLQVGGKLVGGHALLAVGHQVSSPTAGGAPTVILKNSWGPGWGTNGLAEIPVEALAGLLAQDGEACVPVRRSYGR